ncbi:MAG: hypothetical protein BAJATHORv1_10206 [Candidatus Thorarchaeota archaeon]|nr:MAG: hypothetical protein BAJATHORv1_10206 [Candidatus Thorarchaeota archaeon]
MQDEITEDMIKLLHIIHKYTLQEEKEKDPKWIKELPLATLIYKGIITGLFETYDYAPWSVQMLDGTRQWLNVSREAKDDLEDLLRLGLISILRLSTGNYGYITAYRVTPRGASFLSSASEEIKKTVNQLLYCNSEHLRFVEIQNRQFYLFCTACGIRERVSIDDLEDIPYKSRSYLPKYLGIGDLARGEKE